MERELSSSVAGDFFRSRSFSRLVGSVFGGIAFGACLLLLEGSLVVRSGAIGIHLESSGAFPQLWNAVRPQLPPLLARVALAYIAFGVVLGLAAGALVWCLNIRSKRATAVCFLAECSCLVLFLAWHKAIERPALFDDLPVGFVLLPIVNRGMPWHVFLNAALFFAAHLVLAFRRLPSPRRWVALAIPVCAAIVAAFSLRAVFPQFKPHNRLVVLIGVDAFRPDRLSAFGGRSDVAPNIESFTKEAVLFRRAYTPIAQTEPAWNSLLSALWPNRTGVRYPLTPESARGLAPTFVEGLRQAGFRTEFWTDCSRFNYMGRASGFEYRRQPPQGALNFLLEKMRFRALGLFADNAIGAWWLPEFVENRALAGIYEPFGYAKRMGKAIHQAAVRAPTFFAYHATAAHFPGDPVYPFYRRFVPESEPLERRLRMTFAPVHLKTTSAGSREASSALYDELLSQADAQIGILFGELRRYGLYDEALIILFSDHGESFHDDVPNLAGATPVHGARLSEDENRILLAMKFPEADRVSARSIDQLVRLIDIGPTILEWANQPSLPRVDGASLLSILEGTDLAPRKLYAETGFTHATPNVFDADHFVGAPRSFDAYRVRSDGVVELQADLHTLVLQEKDVGAFDGRSWVIRSPRADGTIEKRCLGDCNTPELWEWLEEQM